ncbi:hypothetical protein G6F55_007642 [Rhizopus delemar]|uniref:Reverse transcriptase domain-containing protein n=2 Tax=Rhizopus TaxID=4842 RepID=A0A9P7CMU1_9FUNG|nr:hypothetical protein G6F55_007642 [Rhizopus delemar]KAG1539735.1 hypothetical protein G6F51_008955 [Rhizopus arrhizus]KAG1494052.1 hypothetical protein G6F54_008150 [Rhizopus delemar]KAG1508170.1 hypothetical protein G6F53_008397 [Rhizopus delemar]KAG1521419.1 hypothetical protein G6F52_006763 [Rhizopus delemar]
MPTHKKRDLTELDKHIPTRLASILRKLLERYLYQHLIDNSSTLELAQDCFREARRWLDQILCLACKHTIQLIAATYEESLKESLQHHSLSCSKNMLDDVQMEIIFNNTVSTRFSPVTGDLQESILSPFLYSIYINDLPGLFCTQPLSENLSPIQMTSSLICLLYADDAVLIADKDQMIDLMKACEDPGYRLGIDGILASISE